VPGFGEGGEIVEVHGPAAGPFHADQVVAPGDGEPDVAESWLRGSIAASIASPSLLPPAEARCRPRAESTF
jgi:hypothetical protein